MSVISMEIQNGNRGLNHTYRISGLTPTRPIARATRTKSRTHSQAGTYPRARIAAIQNQRITAARSSSPGSSPTSWTIFIPFTAFAVRGRVAHRELGLCFFLRNSPLGVYFRVDRLTLCE